MGSLPSPDQAEVVVTSSALKALRDRFPGSLVRKIGAQRVGRSGFADVYCCIAPTGRSLWIEMKSARAYEHDVAHGLEMHQIFFGQQILEAGGWWGCACSVAQVIAIAEQCYADDPLYRPMAHEQLNEAMMAHEHMRAERARRKRKALPPTPEQIMRRKLHLRRTRRKYPLKASDFDALRRPTLEG